jgi:hypothetical protein
MQRLACILTLAVLALGCCAPSSAEERKPARPGSFVRYSANTVDDLVNQIADSPTVARRYSSHFGVSPEKLARYFKENLKVITLSAPVKVRTYFISKDGKILSKQRVLPAGRQVFATLAGEMLIETDCGNPVTRKLPPVKTKVLGTTETVPPLPVAEDVLLAPAVAAGPAAVEAVEDAAMRTAAAAAQPVAAFGSAPSFLQIAEAVIPALAGLHYVQTRKSTPVIPEPSSIVPVALACSGLAAAHLRRRWRARKG